MSNIEFMMEYEAAMVSDSDGFFKASMLEECTMHSGFSVKLGGDKNKEYAIGIDPNQGGSASCGVVIVEIGNPHKIVFVKELKKKSTPEMVVEIQKLTDLFNVKMIFMDSQGGGKPIRDLLQEGYNNHIPILDVDDDTTVNKDGKHILKLVNPTSSWISDANFDTLALFENKQLRFPELPRNSNPIAEKLYEEIKILKSQLLNIVVTQTARGVMHFDTPKKGQNKDLYSALVLVSWGVRDLTKESNEIVKVLHPQGYIRPRQPGSIFKPVSNISSTEYTKSAVLSNRVK